MPGICSVKFKKKTLQAMFDVRDGPFHTVQMILRGS